MKNLPGSKVASAAERGDDFYASPYAALPPLLVQEGRRLPRKLWESACGNGALVIPLRNRKFTVRATDLNDWGCPDSEGGVDFLGPVAEREGKALKRKWGDDFGICTNPPFLIIESFIERAVAMAPYVAVLCRLAFLESEGRMGWFQRVGLRRVHIIGERLPMMHRHGYKGPKMNNAGMCFAWFIFEPKQRVTRSVPLRWVSWKAAAKRHPMMEADQPPAAKDQLGLFA